MSESNLQIFRDFLSEAVSWFFKDLELAVEISDASKVEFGVGSRYFNCILGLSNGSRKGSVFFSADKEFVYQTMPFKGEEGNKEELALDWLGEMSNRIVGIYKINLLAFGIDLNMSPPSVTVDEQPLGSTALTPDGVTYAILSGGILGFDCDLESDDLDLSMNNGKVSSLESGQIAFCRSKTYSDVLRIISVDVEPSGYVLEFSNKALLKIPIDSIGDDGFREFTFEGEEYRMLRSRQGLRFECATFSVFFPFQEALSS